MAKKKKKKKPLHFYVWNPSVLTVSSHCFAQCPLEQDINVLPVSRDVSKQKIAIPGF